MDAPGPPTTPLSRSASGRVDSDRASSGRPRRRIGPESEQRTAATTRTAVDPCSLSGVVGDRIMAFYEVDKLKKIIQCYKTGGLPIPHLDGHLERHLPKLLADVPEARYGYPPRDGQRPRRSRGVP